jgi:YHS domain-containing protein
MRNVIRASTFLIIGLLFSAPALAVEPVFSADGAGIHGYDPVADFTDEKPVKGDPAHSATYQGATWHFASAANRDMFTAEPEKFAPQYGGYCAWAVANKYTATNDPDAWSIRDGKLYLNYSKLARARWAIDKSGNIVPTDRNWPGLCDGS